ncbi:MAG: dephospho-CoA kinase, partial [Lachnospiraceae bacterium]
MRIIGITGGVGSGKSQVLRYLKDTFCASIYEADEIARKLQAPGQICYAKMVEQFGREILLDGGEVNREKLAAMVFDDAGKLHQLNEIVHPAVKAYVQEQIAWERN